jgi:hypothetical protein
MERCYRMAKQKKRGNETRRIHEGDAKERGKFYGLGYRCAVIFGKSILTDILGGKLDGETKEPEEILGEVVDHEGKQTRETREQAEKITTLQTSVAKEGFGKFLFSLAQKEYRTNNQQQLVNAVQNEMRFRDEAELVMREAAAQMQYYELVLKAIEAGEFDFDRATNEMIFHDKYLRLGHWQSPLRGGRG